MKYDVCAIGNALVDTEFHVSDDFFTKLGIEKGVMTLVDEERQNQILGEIKQEQMKRQAGGSAANSVVAISEFGGKCFYSCKVANDETGKFFLKDLTDTGVDTVHSGETAPEGTTGKCLVMVTDDADRTMNTFLGITETLSSEEVDEEAIKNSKYLYIEGYLVASETGFKAAMMAKEIAKANDVKVALTFSDPNMIKFFREKMNELLKGGIDLLFCNEDEAKEYTETSNLEEAKDALINVSKHFVMTEGSNGATVFDGDTYIDIEPYEVDAIDTNGAGDMFAGAFLYGITNGHSLAGSAKLASLASSKVVGQYGPRLSWAEMKEIMKKFLENN